MPMPPWLTLWPPCCRVSWSGSPPPGHCRCAWPTARRTRWAPTAWPLPWEPGPSTLAATAITIDLLLADGTLAGGSISPGVAMRLRAMHEHTSRLPLVEAGGEVPLVGYDTTTALRCGAVLGAAAEIDAQTARLKSTLGQLKLFVTGGDAQLLLPHLLTQGVTHDPDLLFKGANVILENREPHCEMVACNS